MNAPLWTYAIVLLFCICLAGSAYPEQGELGASYKLHPQQIWGAGSGLTVDIELINEAGENLSVESYGVTIIMYKDPGNSSYASGEASPTKYYAKHFLDYLRAWECKHNKTKWIEASRVLEKYEKKIATYKTANNSDPTQFASGEGISIFHINSDTSTLGTVFMAFETAIAFSEVTNFDDVIFIYFPLEGEAPKRAYFAAYMNITSSEESQSLQISGIGSIEKDQINWKLIRAGGGICIISIDTPLEYFYFPGERFPISSHMTDYAIRDVTLTVKPSEYYELMDVTPEYFKEIPVGHGGVTHIQGRVKDTIPADLEEIPVIKSIKVKYTDMDGRNLSMDLGPVYAKINPDYAGISEIHFIGKDPSYTDAVVYHLSDLIQLETLIEKSPYKLVQSIAEVCQTNGDNCSEDSRKTMESVINHTLEKRGFTGSYVSNSQVTSEEGYTDYMIHTLYAVFDSGTAETSEFRTCDTVKGDHDKEITIHPRNELILNLSMNAAGSTDNAAQAGELLTQSTKDMIKYNTDCSNLESDYLILAKKCGVCIDYSTLYLSLARALNIPARSVGITFESVDEKGNRNAFGHVFNEVYFGDTWVHAEPQGAWNEPDIYLWRGYENIAAHTEHVAGEGRITDKKATLTYGAGLNYPLNNTETWINLSMLDAKNVYGINLNPPGITHDRYVIQKLQFINNARRVEEKYRIPLFNIDIYGYNSNEYVAEEFSISMTDAGRFNASVSGLEKGNRLDVGEKDYAELSIQITPEVEEKVISAGSIRDTIKIETTYETDEGEKIVKEYEIRIRIVT